jgi:hypothetical protein
VKKDKREAPTKDPTRGKVAVAPLDGPGAGAGTSVKAIAALMEAAAAMKTAQEMFLIPMMMMMTTILFCRKWGNK